MATSGKSIEIKCRRCGKMAKAEDFVLDYVYKMAVCPSCVKERKTNESKTLKQTFKESEKETHEEAPKKQMPAGWDAEDEYLEKLARQKQKADANEDSTPKPYQMGGIPHQASPYSQPKPMSKAEPSIRRAPETQAQPQSKPMSVADFGMRSAGKPVSSSATQENKNVKETPKSMGVTDFGVKSTSKAQSEPAHQQSTSILGQRAEKAESDPDKSKYKCKKCGYEFWYNRERNMPHACPYCNTQVMHLI